MRPSQTYGALSRALTPPAGDPEAFALLGLAEPECAALAAEHGLLFGRCGPARLSPYEGAWRPAAPLHALLAAYARVGLEPDPSFRDRPDHVCAALACMEALGRCEERLAAAGHAQARHRAATSRSAFLTAHVEPWVPRFFDALARAHGAGLHRPLADHALGFLRREGCRLDVTAPPQGAVAPEPAPRCGACGGPLGLPPPPEGLPAPSWSTVCVRCRIRTDLRRTRS